MNEYVKSALLVGAGGLVMWAINKGTDLVDTGADAQTRAIAQQVVDDALVTDSGKTVAQEITEMRDTQARMETNQKHILEALREYARSD